MNDNTSNITSIDPNEFAVAEQEAEASKMIYVHHFMEPFTWEDVTYERLAFDWGALTGKDGLDIENELMAMGRAVIVPALTGDYIVRMATRACTERISYDLLLAIPLYDYNAIRSAARSFLIKSGL